MRSLTDSLHSIWYLLVIFLFIESLHVHAWQKTDDTSNFNGQVLRQILQKKLLAKRKLQNYKDLITAGHIPMKLDSSSIPKIRRKRIGIAGSENLDMILSRLARPRLNTGTTGRYQPRLSVSGGLNRLREMMQKTG